MEPIHALYSAIFENLALMLEAKSLLEKQEGLLLLRLIKRGYRIDMEQIKEGLPPLKINRIIKSVKYMLYWESRIVQHGYFITNTRISQYKFCFYSRVRNEPNASLLALGDCARVKYPAPLGRNAIDIILQTGWLFYLATGIAIVAIIYAIVSSVVIECLHLATARGSNTPPLWGELAKEKLSHAPLLCSGVFDYNLIRNVRNPLKHSLS